jgi:lysine-N-methylase
MKGTKASQPQYFKKFVCTMDKCVYNCCHHNWQIRVDKNTYDKYVKLNSDIGREILDNIKVVSKDPFIAIIVINKEGHCHFLDEKGFCSIQLKLGYDYLGRTCRIHPRSISYINGLFETYLELSCEEAVRLILFEKEPMILEDGILEPDGSGNIIPNRMLIAEKYTSDRNAVGIFTKLRMTSTAIMQSRQYPLRSRMLLLCLFIEQVEQLLESRQDSKIIACADESLKMLSTGIYDNLVEQIPGGIDTDFEIILDILKEMSERNSRDERFNTILKQALEGHGISYEDFMLPDSLHENYKNLYNEYFAEREYIFENYIVNHILQEGFPFTYNKDSGVMVNYADLLAKYNLIEFLLTGICSHCGEFDEWSIIDCVSSYSRCYDHAEKGYLMME